MNSMVQIYYNICQCIYCFICAVFCLSAHNTNASIEIDGTLECAFYASDGAAFTNQTLHFLVQLYPGNRWRLIKPESETEYWDYSCNGTDTFAFFDSGKEPRVGYVRSGVVPADYYPIVAPWIAYCSSDYLKTNASVPTPWANPMCDPEANIYTNIIQPIAERPFLPKHIEWRVDEEKSIHATDVTRNPSFSLAGRTIAELQRLKHWRTQEPPGFLGGDYDVISVTNGGGFCLASEFRFRRYSCGPKAASTKENGRNHESPTNVSVAVTYIGRINRVSTLETNGDIPHAGTRLMHVHDLRFPENQLTHGFIRYATTNDWIVDINDKRLKDIIDKERKHGLHLTAQNIKHIACYCVAFIIVIIPILSGFKSLKGRWL